MLGIKLMPKIIISLVFLRGEGPKRDETISFLASQVFWDGPQHRREKCHSELWGCPFKNSPNIFYQANDNQHDLGSHFICS
jgi:hypothetical protein